MEGIVDVPHQREKCDILTFFGKHNPELIFDGYTMSWKARSSMGPC